jgi:hypothetical protein
VETKNDSGGDEFNSTRLAEGDSRLPRFCSGRGEIGRTNSKPMNAGSTPRCGFALGCGVATRGSLAFEIRLPLLLRAT